MWIDEKQNYDLASGICQSDKECGQYTAMIWHDTVKVGCGATKCPGMGFYLVCDYLPAGYRPGSYDP